MPRPAERPGITLVVNRVEPPFGRPLNGVVEAEGDIRGRKFLNHDRFIQAQRGVGRWRRHSARPPGPIVVMGAVEIQPESHPSLFRGTDCRQGAIAIDVNITGAIHNEGSQLTDIHKISRGAPAARQEPFGLIQDVVGQNIILVGAGSDVLKQRLEGIIQKRLLHGPVRNEGPMAAFWTPR
jgi:hypothetical protein